MASVERNITVQLEVPISSRFVLCQFEHCCFINGNLEHKLLAAEHSTRAIVLRTLLCLTIK